MAGAEPENSADPSSETESIASAKHFCRTCCMMLPESSSLKAHKRHRIATVADCAGDCKVKLHEMLSLSELEEKNLVKAAKIVTDCRDNISVTTKNQIEDQMYACFDIAMKQCEKEIDKRAFESVDCVKEVEMQRLKANLLVNDAKRSRRCFEIFFRNRMINYFHRWRNWTLMNHCILLMTV